MKEQYEGQGLERLVRIVLAMAIVGILALVAVVVVALADAWTPEEVDAAIDAAKERT